MKKAIVTGAKGFIGSALTTRLRKDGVEVVELDLSMGHDLSEPISLKEHKADVLFHLAGCSDSHQNPADCFRVNTLSMLNVLDAIRETGMRLVFASTYLTDTGSYALSKRTCETMIDLWRKQYGLATVVVKCCNVYGPGDYNTKRIIPSLITKMLHNDPVEVNSSQRDFVFINDAVDAYVSVASLSEATVGVSSSGLIALPHIAGVIHQKTKSNSSISVTSDGNQAVEADDSLLRKLGWMPSTPFAYGLQATIDWWKDILKK